ncbi:ParA family protein [Magnetospirillum sulfuroxidans]|uniref:ParA family protein n=1 Tax=Magnetospirillum sulfuroxidans TaxID=611300 RepID=A0ABS5ICY4_9PROT|nr:ParA family protein [Magnetospirillum sulfuroxidans]MBR9972283.1 ParA family protein [Magnetospirillum sulfuroxidans]
MAEENAAADRRSKPTIITVFNQKGGVGKTTSSVNLAVCMAALGKRVVLVDLDSQSNATTNVGVTPPISTGAYQLITGRAPLDECLRKTDYDNLRLVGGSDELAWADIELAMQPECQGILSGVLATAPDDIDIVVIDCPPAPGIVSVNALVAADVVVMPVMPSPHALDGLHKAWWNVNRVRSHYNHDLHTINIVLTMTEDGPLTQRLTEDIIAEFGPRVMPVLVPRDNVVIEAAARDLPVVSMAPQSPPARAYLRLAELLLTRVLHMTGGAEESRLSDALEHETAADKLAVWSAELNGRRSDLTIPQPGEMPDPGWTKAPELTAEVLGPGAGWKIGAGLMLIVLGAVLGFAAAAAWYQFPTG